MSLKDLLGTTARAGVYRNITNSDQIPMQQAKAPRPAPSGDAEVLDDVDHGGGDGGGDGGAEVSEATGLTAEEQAEFDRMAQGGGDDPEPPPAGDEFDDSDGDEDGQPGDDVPPLARPGPQKTPAELAAEAAAGQRPPKQVSYGRHQRALKEANDRAAALQTQVQKEREDRIKLAERVAIINEALQAQAAAPPPVDPDAPPANPFEEANIDPKEDYAGALDQERRRNRYAYEANQQTTQQVTESNEDRELRDNFERDFRAQAVAVPELPQAYQFLKDSRLTEICISEFDKDPNDPNEVFTKAEVEKMVQMFNAEEKWVVGAALKQGKSPAMAIMKLARARGFKVAPAAAPAPVPAPAPKPRNGVVPAAPRALVAPAAPSAADAVAALAAAREAGKSLSDGGGAPPQGLSAEILLSMDDDEFADMVDSLPKHQLDALMGRSPG